ncbi:MAG: ROK family protein [Oscillospiraceae bacterium]|nr:ROK family protein [Oscillospiraceae bacterium]
MRTLGIDLGGTQIKCGVVENGSIIEERVCDTPAGGYKAVVSCMARQARLLMEKCAGTEYVGVGTPGLIDTAAGIVRYSNNIGWHDAPVRADLETLLGRPVRIANDAQCAALGEALYGAGRGCDRMAMLTVGTGVGGGFVRDGELETDGYGSMAYIFGHSIIAYDGKLCNCGRRGCLEAYASASAVAKRGERVFVPPKSVREIFEAARREDAVALGIVREFLDYLSAGVVNIANILRPRIIVIGGGVSGSCDMILPVLNEALKRGVYGYEYAPVRAVCAELGNCAGLAGAASLWRGKNI